MVPSLVRYLYPSDPKKVLEYGPGYNQVGDPLRALQEELRNSIVDIPEHKLPILSGGAVGYLSFDCIQHFEPATATQGLRDNLQLPEALFMLYDTIIAFDHFHSLNAKTEVPKLLSVWMLSPQFGGRI